MSRVVAKPTHAPRLLELLEVLGRWIPGPRSEPEVELDIELDVDGVEPEPWERRVDALRRTLARRPVPHIGPVLDTLAQVLVDETTPSPPIRRAVELAEDIVALSRRGRSDRASSVADALREATSRLAGEEACRIRLQLPTEGLTVAGHQRLLGVAELALRHGLLASPHRVVGASVREEGSFVHILVGYGEPSADPWLHHLYLGLLMAAVSPLEGGVFLRAGGVEVRLDRFTLADELSPMR